jgi:hypothetical protein
MREYSYFLVTVLEVRRNGEAAHHDWSICQRSPVHLMVARKQKGTKRKGPGFQYPLPGHNQNDLRNPMKLLFLEVYHLPIAP